MQFEGAVVREQGVSFGIIVVKRNVLTDVSARENARRFGVRAFGRMPIVLMTQDGKGIPTYQGRSDLVKFLAAIDFRRIPWRRYTITD